jgi:4-carboxymuconolactone decarboxylase
MPNPERLPRLTPGELDSDQVAVYQSIRGGPRGGGKQVFDLHDAQGALNGPFGIMLHHPALGMPLQELGSAIRFRTTMTDRSREIAILIVAAHLDSEFEWYAHSRVGRAVGLSEAELNRLRYGRFDGADPVEAAVRELAEAVLSGLDLAADDYARLRGVLGETIMLEVVALIGYYRTLSDLMRVFDVGAPSEDA